MKNLKRVLLLATLSMVIFLGVFSCMNDTAAETPPILDIGNSARF